MNIYVYNLCPKLNDKDLEKLFSTYGEVLSAEIQLDKIDGQSQCIGYVHMPIEAQAQNAVIALNNREINGKRIVVQREGYNPRFQSFT